MIYIIWGFPGGGKSYFATRRAYHAMKAGKKVFTNYPVMYLQKPSLFQRFLNIFRKKENRRESHVVSSYVWKSSYLKEYIVGALIIIDEAYRDYSSRNWQKFTEDIHTNFATNRHNDNDFYLIAQNPARLDVVIREMVNIFYYCRCWTILGYPLFFRVEGYLDEHAMAARYNNPNAIYSIKYFLLNRKIAAAYDTRYFRKVGGNEIEYETWFDQIQRENLT